MGGVHPAKGQPACSSTTLGQEASVLGGRVCLTKGQPDLKQFQTWSLDVTTGVGGGVHMTKGQPA